MPRGLPSRGHPLLAQACLDSRFSENNQLRTKETLIRLSPEWSRKTFL